MTVEARAHASREQRPWSDADETWLEDLWKLHGGRISKIAHIMGRSRGSISGKSRNMNLQFVGGRGRVLEPDHPAAVTGVSAVAVALPPPADPLKPGNNQRKLGSVVTKGPWKGAPIYSLTLEERATCPRTCLQWLNCYGNNMGMSKRYQHGRELERQIWAQLIKLQREHFREKFVVRLHILGDFYSVANVGFWQRAIAEFPALRVFGYTAWQIGTAIGDAVAALAAQQWDRFAIRVSGASTGPRTLVINHASDLLTDDALLDSGAILCPAQDGKTPCCATCGLCWAPAARHRPIAFLSH